MRRNVHVMVVVSVLFGLSFGVYEQILPFFLDSRGVSRVHMGYIYAAGGLAPFLLRVLVGGWSDAVGRKVFYGLSLLVCAAANAFSPLSVNAWLQAALKGARESAVEVRATLHTVLLYENSRHCFIDAIGKTQGAEKIVESLGYPIGGAIISLAALTASGMAYSAAFYCSVTMLVVAAIVFLAGYSESQAVGMGNSRPSLRDFVSLDLNAKLYILILAALIFNLGLGCSHSFAMNLFFAKKFDVSEFGTSLILMLHRLLLGLPMLFAGMALRGNLKAIFIVFMAVEGALIAGGGLIPWFWLATGVWLLHDLFGAGIWIPIQSELIQRYSRSASRAMDVAKVMALSSITLFPGHILAGYLCAVPGLSEAAAISLPFIVGGALIGASALVLLFL